MDMDVKIIASLIGLGGILITAILSSAGYLYKNKLEAKKSARTVLYLLLELRYVSLTSLFDPNKATEKYFDHYIIRLNERGIPTTRDEIEEPLRELVISHFTNVIDTLKTDIHENILEPYETSLMSFAAINPVLAYKLKGKDKIEKLIHHTENYIDSLNTEIFSSIDEDWLNRIFSAISNEIKDETYAEVINDLDEDILILALHCSRSDYKNCKRTLADGFNEKNKYDFSDLDHLIDKLITKVSQHVVENPELEKTRSS